MMIPERGDSYESKTTAFESVPMAPPTTCNKQASELCGLLQLLLPPRPQSYISS